VSQEAAVVTRSLIEIRRFFISNAAGAFVVRGTREQMDAARWLVEALDRQSFTTAINEYRITDTAGEDTIRLFLVSKFNSPEELQNFAVELRQATQMRRVFVYNPLRVIAVRSTPAQVKQAESIVNKL
jgi:citrate lyase beta subunit